MVAKIVVAPEAAQDVAEAYAWYEGRREGLGEEFLGCLEASIGVIRRAPEIHPVVHESFRRAMVRRFPYAVFYEYASGVATIYGVFHTSRQPAAWLRRVSAAGER